MNLWHAIGAWLSSKGLGLIWILLFGAVVYWISAPLINWLTRHIARGLRSKTPAAELKKRQKTLAGLFITVTHVLVILVVIFTILSAAGLNLAPLLASAGVAGIALGFGAQSLVKDAIAGFFIILENQYRVGDYVEITGIGLSDSYGTVEKVSIRSTSLRDRDGNVHFIPNGSIVQVINKTLGYSKVHFTFNVDKATDLAELEILINNLGRQMAQEKAWQNKIIDPPHFVEVGAFDKAGASVTVSGITPPSDQWNVSGEFKKRLLSELKKHGVQVV
ncbi:MAG: mechanosensitive ion channel family protein [Candidatus Nomurabacteria bacterium]|nr:mechanosensitive ion channel family protein [Candidatus Nomurabacteria bacterium]